MATSYGSPRIFMDPVHGSIELEGYLVRIIDTPEFQRLRKIKQLGGVCYVYPGATHTRFEHSIGVCHIAGHLVGELRKNSAVEYYITDVEEICIKIAALCHDIGHGPFSHLYDFAIKNHLGRQNVKKHEYRSAEIVEKVIKRLAPDSNEQLKTAAENIELIKAMILFSEKYEEYETILNKDFKTFCDERGTNISDPNEKEAFEKEKKDEKEKKWNEIAAGKPKTKSYLFEIVANGFTGVDVDKMDYFTRDSRSVGLPNSFDWRRYSQTTSIRQVETDDGSIFCRICSREKDATTLYELFHTRYILHRTVYKHKTVIIIEDWIMKALQKANDAILINEFPLLECWKNEKAFIHLTDSIEEIIVKEAECIPPPTEPPTEPPNGLLWKIHPSGHTALKEAKDLIDKIKTRNLPKFVSPIPYSEENETSPEGFIHKTVTFDYGKGSGNPLKCHYFYNKDKDTTTQQPFTLDEDKVSAFLPKKYYEKKIFQYKMIMSQNDRPQ